MESSDEMKTHKAPPRRKIAKCVCVPEELLARINEAREEQGYTFSAFARRAIRAAVKEWEAQKALE